MRRVTFYLVILPDDKGDIMTGLLTWLGRWHYEGILSDEEGDIMKGLLPDEEGDIMAWSDCGRLLSW